MKGLLNHFLTRTESPEDNIWKFVLKLVDHLSRQSMSCVWSWLFELLCHLDPFAHPRRVNKSLLGNKSPDSITTIYSPSLSGRSCRSPEVGTWGVHRNLETWTFLAPASLTRWPGACRQSDCVLSVVLVFVEWTDSPADLVPSRTNGNSVSKSSQMKKAWHKNIWHLMCWGQEIEEHIV